jgi:RecB family exonuclease
VPDGLVAARLAVLAEFDARGARRNALGPFLGLVGAPRNPADPRAGPPSVTAVERIARCPWLGFLERVLRVKAVRDPRDALPSAADRRLLGNVVHGALERIVERVLTDRPETLEEARGRAPIPVAWPEPDELETILADAAAEIVAQESIAVPGYARVLARRAAPALAVARSLDWATGSVDVVGVEVAGEVRLRDRDGGERSMRFRADRVDVDPRGALRITDYKTGAPFAKQTGADARLNAHVSAVRKGRALQATAYALAGGEGAEGRYLYLGDVPDERVRELATRAEPDIAAGFRASTDALLEAWDRGAFAPRLRLADRDEEPSTCRSCEVKEACLRGDSGARLRLARWAEEARPDALARPERACLELWRLGTEDA